MEDKEKTKWPQGLIPEDYARIAWRTDGEDEKQGITKIEVMFSPSESFFSEEGAFNDWTHKEEIRLKHKKLSLSFCSQDYKGFDLATKGPSASPFQGKVIEECIRILISDFPSDRKILKKCLFEMGKIETGIMFRNLLWDLFLSNELPRDSLEQSLYGWDFCNRPGGHEFQ